jgi:hypothetical protein
MAKILNDSRQIISKSSKPNPLKKKEAERCCEQKEIVSNETNHNHL